MKAGIAAAVEALHILRETRLLPGGSVLFTAHDLHEAPWGDASQLNRLIDEGYVGDGVLIPEYIHDLLPVIGRGNAQIEITISRPGAPVHEVFRPRHEPNVIAVGALTVQRILSVGSATGRNTPSCSGAGKRLSRANSQRRNLQSVSADLPDPRDNPLVARTALRGCS